MISKKNFLYCIGNYLLLTGEENGLLGNGPFKVKREAYTHLLQQKEVRELTKGADPFWGKEQITERHQLIVESLKTFLGCSEEMIKDSAPKNL